MLFLLTQEIKTKQPDRTNFGFRVSDGIAGRLQVEALFLRDICDFTINLYCPLI